jgi:hypothetical protein
MSGYLNDVCLPLLCLLNCMISTFLYDFCLYISVWCLPTVLSAYFYYVCLAVWCLLIFIISGYLYLWCLATYMIRCLSICIPSYLYYVCLFVCENVAFFCEFRENYNFRGTQKSRKIDLTKLPKLKYGNIFASSCFAKILKLVPSITLVAPTVGALSI